MREMSVTVTAFSEKEMDKVIADRKAQGYSLKRRGWNFSNWGTRKYYAIMYKEEVTNAN
jgi:hypothetical protein